MKSALQKNLSVHLLGEFRVSAGEHVMGEGGWSSRKAKSLVKLLALAPDCKLHREQVLEALWPGTYGASANTSLRKALHFARRALAPSEDAVACPYLQTRDEHLLLSAPDNLSVDVGAFRTAALLARRSNEIERYRQALALYKGELLPEDRYEDWAIGPREELRNLYLLLLIEAGRLYEVAGEHEAAVDVLNKALDTDPLNEDAHLGLMRSLALDGRSGEAVRRYTLLRKALEREVGVQPQEALQNLHRAIENGELAPPVQSPTYTPQAGARRHNLTLQLTSFIGRKREIAEVGSMLSRTRLLTLTGVGGSGKTRLALEAASQMLDDYLHGVWLIELAELSDPALVPQSVASALGIRDQPLRPLADTLSDYLQNKQILLVLDNCEHLVRACAELAEKLLRACPGLKLLATSREALNIGGEIIWTVPPLSLPRPSNGDTTEEALDPMQYEAPHLFVERAASASPDFQMDAIEKQAVVQICLRLDGIPLAIELAAARARVLSAVQIAERLTDAFQLLTVASRTALPRHQTLRAVVDWSYGLLTDKEKALFRRLSIFAGGFTLDAAEQICAGEPLEPYEVLDVLSHLVEKSLLILEQTDNGARRYRVLETLRQYGREKLLESGERELIHAPYARYYALLCNEAGSQLHGPDQIEWLDRLNSELANIRAVLEWCRAYDPEMGMLLAGSITRFWDIRGYLTEGRRHLDNLLALSPPRTILRAKALYTSGYLASRQGQLDEGVGLLQDSVNIYTELDDQPGLAWALERLGIAISLQGSTEVGLTYLNRGIANFRRIGYKAGLAWALGSAGMNFRTIGDYAGATETLSEGYTLARELGDLHTIVYILNNLGQLARINGDFDKASALLEECLDLCRRMKNKPFVCWTLECVSTVARMRGDYLRAIAPLGESLQMAREMGIHRHLARCIYSAGVVATHFGQSVEAVKLFSATMGLYPNTRVSLDEDELLEWDKAMETARSALTDAVFSRAWDEGSAMTWDQAYILALQAIQETTAPIV